jgi:hypothetical protein
MLVLTFEASPFAICCLPLQPPLIPINQPKVPVSNEDYREVITTNIRANRMVRRVKRNIGKYAARESIRYPLDLNP